MSLKIMVASIILYVSSVVFISFIFQKTLDDVLLNNKVLLCADFDNTIIFKDTTAPLLTLAAESHRENETMMAIWNSTLKTYLEDTDAVVSHYTSFLKDGDDIAFNKTGLNSFLQAYHAVDSAAIDTMNSIKFLSGISLSDISKTASSLQSAVDPSFNNNYLIHHIISLNWSQNLVKRILNSAENLKFYGNSIGFTKENVVSTGVMTRVLETPWDKQKLLQHLVSGHHNEITSIFVGDSVSDLLALLDADIGLVIKPESRKKEMLIEKTARIYNIKLLPVSKLVTKNIENTLYVVQSWSQIYDVINKM